MARGRGGRSDWERYLAAQRREALAAQREAERQVREQARLAKEREKQERERHVAAQQQTAEAKSATVTAQVNALDEVLPVALSRPPFNFGRLEVVANVPRFDPGPLAVAGVAPNWQDYAPAEPAGLARVFGGTGRYQRAVAADRTRWEAATADFERVEADRQRALASAQADHDRKVAAAQARAAEHNAELSARRATFAAGEPEAVEWYVARVLDASRYPDGFPKQHQIAYRPENRDVVLEVELPPQAVVPSVREYRYVKTRDAIDPAPRLAGEIKQRYARLIACVALRTLHEIFTATPAEVVEAVVLNGRVSTIDRATGKNARPHLISVEAERSAFTDLVLAEVDPAACLKYLNALVSPNPFDLEAVEPFIAFDLKRFRFIDDAGALADLDSRRNLLTLSWTEFEHLITDLFVAMGAEAWQTIPSKDGGVDAVATSKHLFFGGVCLIQAKRWTNPVGVEAVHALTGVMTDHNATTGVLATTAWFTRGAEQFAQRNRITLINGAELKHLIKQHLGVDVIPGTTPPRRLRASDNTQTGRPGPATR
jgi:restriction system protein